MAAAFSDCEWVQKHLLNQQWTQRVNTARSFYHCPCSFDFLLLKRKLYRLQASALGGSSL
ncbi:hypothetical protein ACRRTK_014617 [Alexandromys fortis]